MALLIAQWHMGLNGITQLHCSIALVNSIVLWSDQWLTSGQGIHSTGQRRAQEANSLLTTNTDHWQEGKLNLAQGFCFVRPRTPSKLQSQGCAVSGLDRIWDCALAQTDIEAIYLRASTLRPLSIWGPHVIWECPSFKAVPLFKLWGQCFIVL